LTVVYRTGKGFPPIQQHEDLLENFVWWVHQDDTPRMKSLFRETMENKNSGSNVEYKGIKKDGCIWYASQSWETVKDSQGNMIQFVIHVLDITDRKNIEETLIQSEFRFSSIINNLPDPTLVIDQNGKVIAWNKAIEDLTGVKAEDMVGRGNYEYSLPFYRKRRPILIDLIFESEAEIAKKLFRHRP
jgi:PAS domain-containing protein